MRVFPFSDMDDSKGSFVPLVRALLESSTHAVGSSPEDADLLLYPDCHLTTERRLRTLAHHPLLKRHGDRTIVYNERDRPWLEFAGLYVSMPSPRFRADAQVAMPYLSTEGDRFADLRAVSVADADLLFSFVGSPTHPVRMRVQALEHPRAHVERVDGFLHWDHTSSQWDERRHHFHDVIRRSKFVLCPRGHGTSSIRLAEVMASGRVPVIIADDWVPYEGPDWPRCSIRVREADVESIPSILEDRESEADALAHAAATAYDDLLQPRKALQRALDLFGTRCQPAPPPRTGLRRFADAGYLRLTASETLGGSRRLVGTFRGGDRGAVS